MAGTGVPFFQTFSNFFDINFSFLNYVTLMVQLTYKI